MKILFLSFYSLPDLSAVSFRSSSLVNALLDQLPYDSEIDVLTTLPNRYYLFKSDAKEIETYSRLKIKRIKIPKHKNGMIDQCKVFGSFAKNALHFLSGKDYDLIYATSGRLMTASLGAFIANKIGKPLYLDIRDIFVDTIKDVLPRSSLWILVPLFSMLENYTINSACKVNLLSLGFLPYFKTQYPNKNYSIFTNGIDEEFLKIQIQKNINNSKILNVVYAGNIGEGQGLHKIIPELAKKFQDKLHFRLVGDGGKRVELMNAIKKNKYDNIELILPIKREDLIKIYVNADILFLHLNDYPAFKKVLPSKLFEYASTGKPIWAGVSGHAEDFITKNIDNAAVFSPGNVDEAVASFKNLKIINKPRAKFIRKFARRNIAKKMAHDIIKSVKIDSD